MAIRPSSAHTVEVSASARRTADSPAAGASCRRRRSLCLLVRSAHVMLSNSACGVYYSQSLYISIYDECHILHLHFTILTLSSLPSYLISITTFIRISSSPVSFNIYQLLSDLPLTTLTNSPDSLRYIITITPFNTSYHFSSHSTYLCSSTNIPHSSSNHHPLLPPPFTINLLNILHLPCHPHSPS
jgi:hypothetical protein